jgi:hypothetical protein
MITKQVRLFSTKPPKFLQRMEHAAAKEGAKDRLTKKIAQDNKKLPRNVGKVIKGRDLLPEKPYINYMDAENTVFLGEKFSSRANLL